MEVSNIHNGGGGWKHGSKRINTPPPNPRSTTIVCNDALDIVRGCAELGQRKKGFIRVVQMDQKDENGSIRGGENSSFVDGAGDDRRGDQG